MGLSAGGSVPVGTFQYYIEWGGVDGIFSASSPTVNAVVTAGNQTVTLTPPAAPPGAVGYIPYRSAARANIHAFGNCASAVIPVATAFVDASSFVWGQSLPNASPASAIVAPNAISGQQLRLTNNGNVVSTNFPN